MTFGQIRFIKWALLALLLASSGYVGLVLLDGVRTREVEGIGDLGDREAAVSREVEIQQLDSEGRTAWTLKAAESTGRTESSQKFRDVEIRFEAGKERVPVVATAEHCEVEKDSSVYLEGNVVVRDDGSLRLESDTLHYERYPDRVWTIDPVRYFRKGLEGDAGNMRYILDGGILDLGGGVSMTLQRGGEAPVRVRAESAAMRREIHRVQFIDAVRVRQSNRSLECNDLQVYLAEGDEVIERMEAYENVVLRMDVPPTEAEDEEAGAPDSVGAARGVASEPGTKRLFTDRLEVLYRPGGEHLERARAVEGGRLVMTLPEGTASGYHKELEGYTLAFEFDEQGRLELLRGRGGVTLVLTPPSLQGEEKKTVTSRQLEAFFDPDTGDLREARCERAVTFEQGAVRAAAELGTFRSGDSLLLLEEDPRLWDEQASLDAVEIRIDVDSGDVEGKGKVRSTSTRPGDDRLFPGGGDEPVYFVSEHVRFERARDLATYTGAARGIQGPNRVEADRIEILQGKGDLDAQGNVRTVFLQKVRKSGTAEAPTVTDAERLAYRASEEELHYRGLVSMRATDLTLRGGKIDVVLVPGVGDVAEIHAEGDVTIETAEGKASGEHARYLPDEERMTVSGESAWLENAGKLTEGKHLTFFLSDDRILVDGREQARTKTTYSSKPRP